MTQLAAAYLPTQQAPTLRCRACLSDDVKPFFDMNLMPLANGFLDSPDDPEEKFPLTLCRCDKCGMVQLGNVVPKERLYEDYSFRTSSSKAMVEHFRDLFIQSEPCEINLPASIIEIGSNDGFALSEFADWKVDQDYSRPDVMGIEPARNLAAIAAMRGIPTIPEFFTEELAQRIVAQWHGQQAKLIVACNVLGHIDDLDDFLRGVKTLLHEGGRFVFEVPYLPQTIGGGQYDQIYHEHLNYFSHLPIYLMLQRHGLLIESIKGFDVHGGTIRVTAAHMHNVSRMAPYSYRAFPLDACERFAERVQDLRLKLRHKLEMLKAAGKNIIGYCASAKGTITLNYCGIGTDLIDTVIDDTPEKQGRYMPGTHQHIMPSKWTMGLGVGDHEPPDAILILSENHAEEIKAKHAEYRGEWILPHEVR